MLINDEDLFKVSGGAITSTFINALSRLVSTLQTLGKAIGSTLYRIKNKNYCS